MSAAASATNQNAWIGFMKQELKKYPNVHLVSTVYGNDDPTTATQVTQGLLQQYPTCRDHLADHRRHRRRGGVSTRRSTAARSAHGSRHAASLKKYVDDGTIHPFELWDPANLGYLAAYAAVNVRRRRSGARRASVQRRQARQQQFGPDNTIILGPPTVFNKINIAKFNF